MSVHGASPQSLRKTVTLILVNRTITVMIVDASLPSAASNTSFRLKRSYCQELTGRQKVHGVCFLRESLLQSMHDNKLSALYRSIPCFLVLFEHAPPTS